MGVERLPQEVVEAIDEAEYGLTPKDVLEYTLERSADNVRLIKEQEAALATHAAEIAAYGFDDLTGAMTRKAFTGEAERTLALVRGEVEEHRKGHDALGEAAIIYIDLDNFKQVNDTLSHAEGDKALKAAVQVFSESVRHETDKVGRLGGDEFAILLPGASESAAAAVAEKICSRMRADTTLGGYGITGSVGVCSSGVTARTEELIHCADLAAKEAKQGGKNRVVVYQKSTES